MIWLLLFEGHDRKDAKERDHRQHLQRRGRQHARPRRRPQVRKGFRRRSGRLRGREGLHVQGHDTEGLRKPSGTAGTNNLKLFCSN